MDSRSERIFVRDSKPQAPGNSSSKFLVIAAIALVLVGLVGILYVSGSNKQPEQQASNTNTNTQPTVEPDVDETKIPEDEDITPPADNTPEPEPQTDDGTSVEYTAPTNETKVNVYFVKNPETTNNNKLVPVLRDKPSENLTTFLLTQVVNGPNTEEKAQGYQTAWTFSGTPSCGSSSLFKYTLSGTILNLTICRNIDGNLEQLKESLNVTVPQATSITRVKVLNSEGAEL